MRVALTVLFYFLVNTVLTQENGHFSIGDSAKFYRLEPVTRFFPDSTGALSFAEVRKAGFQSNFRELEKSSFEGFPALAVWLKIPVTNQTATESWQLVLRSPEHHRSDYRFEYLAGQGIVDVYVTGRNDIVQHLRTGMMVPESQKSLASHPSLNAVALSLPMADSLSIFARIENPETTIFNLSAELRPLFMEIPYDISREASSISFAFGVAAILSLLSFLFFVFVKDRSYLFFGFFALLLGLHYTILHPGALFIRHMVPERPWLLEYVWIFLTRGSFIFFALFGSAFTNLGSTSKWLNRSLLALAALMVVEMLVAFIISPAQRITQPVPLFSFIIVGMILVGIRILFLPGHLAKIFGAGASWFFLFTILGILWQAIDLPLPFNPWMVGQLGLMVIYTIGLAYKLQLNERARAEAQRVIELDALKSRFFANISHEFRTPLTLILGPLKKAQEQLPASDQDFFSQNGTNTKQDVMPDITLPARHVVMMRRNAERLGQLINQLLDLSKLENGSMPLQVTAGDVVPLIRALVFSFESLAEQRQIHFQTTFPEAGQTVYFNRDHLEKIVVNLLSNAFKYTPTGGRVAVKITLTDGRLKISVEDSGPGIEQPDLDKIFERFYQVEGTGDKGTGIGLSLVKELVELYRGQISVDSAAGRGTVFKVSLPAAKEAFSEQEITNRETTGNPPPPATLPADLADENGPAEPTTNQTGNLPLLLIVEDNPDLRRFIAETMQSEYQILTTENGKLGLAAALEHIPDLIVSDVMMPEMNGLELCEKLKTDERTSHIPIILLTAKAGQRYKVEGLETGADAYLTKPFDELELQVRARNLVELRRKLQERFGKLATYPKITTLKPSEIAVVSTDERFLRKVSTAIEENMDNEFFSVEDLAGAVAFSRSQLHRKLKMLTGKSPNELIRSFRLARAKELLEKGHGNVSEVAMEVGYSSLSYFTRSFKAAYGVLPGEM